MWISKSLRFRENLLNINQYGRTEFYSGVVLTKIQCIFTEYQTLIQISSESIAREWLLTLEYLFPCEEYFLNV